jgi:hypothetical protein
MKAMFGNKLNKAKQKVIKAIASQRQHLSMGKMGHYFRHLNPQRLNFGDLSKLTAVIKSTTATSIKTPINKLAKDPFWLLVLVSAGAHAAFWLLLPNPIQTSDRSQPEEIEVISVVPVVDLPTQDLANTKPIDPVSEPLTTPPLDLLADGDLELNPADSDRRPFDSIPEADLNSGQIIALNPQEASEQVEDTEELSDRQAQQDDPKINDPGQQLELDDREQQRIAQTKPETSQTESIAKDTNADDLETTNNPNEPSNDQSGNVFFKDDPGDRNDEQTDSINTDLLASTDVSEEITTSNDQAFQQIITDSKYSGKLLIRVIAPAEKAVKSEHREPQVDWIPLDLSELEALKAEINNLSEENKEINIALLVNPEGTVEKTFIETSNIKELDAIIRNTAKAYYDKFEPISQQSDSQSIAAKYRYVTIKYELDRFNFN